ncbi:helix-turn-helix domain-containing protein [Paenibacillus alkalitolerans]|uniref:helix-turn-helix domain-containing protein n=1 Tax=Paenibacillus alkalitolerans TaxID=2799335 RepID=UPI0018F4B51C|nr:helix-turn-helix domain-containing protein [Paenibacillus alkalitolerans]
MMSIMRRKYAGSNRRSIFIRMLVSNCLLLLLPVILWFVFYTNIDHIMKSNAERSNLAMLEQLRLSLDSNFNEVEQLSHQIILNPKLGYLLETKNNDLSQRYLLVEFTRDYLKVYPNIISSFVHDFYIFLDRSDSVIKPNLVTDSNTFYDKYYSFENLAYEEWRKLMTSYHSQSYMPVSTLQRHGSLNEAPLKVIPYMQSLPVEDSSDIKGNLTILIDETKIHEMTRQIELANGSSVYVVNKQREILSNTPGAVPLPASIVNEFTSQSGILNYMLDGQSMMVSFTTSGELGWYYIAVMPLDLYFQKVKQMEQLALWLLILCIFMGGVGAYAITYRNYFPIKRIVESISSRMPHPHKPAVNEFDYIMEMMNVSWDEEKHIKHKLTQQLPILRSNYLHRVLHGYFESPEQMIQSLEFMGIRFPFPHFVVILVHIDNLSRFAPDQSEKQWALARFVISNLAEDSVYDSHTIHTIELEKDQLAMIVNLIPERLDHPKCRIGNIVSELQQILEGRFKLDISFAVSGVHQGQYQLGEAYLEATAALEYKMVNGNQSIFYFHDIRQEKLKYHYPVETELQLMNSIRSGDKEQVVMLLTRLFEMNFRDESITPELGRCLLFSLAGTLLRILNSNTIAYQRLSEAGIDPVRVLLSCKTTEEMFEKAKSLYLSAAESFKMERSDHSEQLLQQIQSYIEANFAEPNMSLNLLSEHLQITPQYISHFFKKMSGQNISDYLTIVRMEHAKKLMEDPEFTISKIAKMVGYTSDTAFIRVFKKVEGITPGKYKESISSRRESAVT